MKTQSFRGSPYAVASMLALVATAVASVAVATAFSVAVLLNVAHPGRASAMHHYDNERWPPSKGLVLWVYELGFPSGFRGPVANASHTWSVPSDLTLAQGTLTSGYDGVVGTRSFSALGWDTRLAERAFAEIGPSGYLEPHVEYYFNSDKFWTTDADSMDGVNWFDIETVALHEFGHFVKLKDSCIVEESAMCAKPFAQRSLDQHDEDTLIQVYGTTTGGGCCNIKGYAWF